MSFREGVSLWDLFGIASGITGTFILGFTAITYGITGIDGTHHISDITSPMINTSLAAILAGMFKVNDYDSFNWGVISTGLLGLTAAITCGNMSGAELENIFKFTPIDLII